ncbi:MAG: hypothetical protein U0T82_10700 [Bacteroidales bacterium]
MKRLIFLFLFSLGLLTARGRDIFIETGKLLGSIDYKNSKERSSHLDSSIRNNLGMEYRQPLFSTPLHLSVEPCTALFHAGER